MNTLHIDGLQRRFARDVFSLQLFEDWRLAPLTNDDAVSTRLRELFNDSQRNKGPRDGLEVGLLLDIWKDLYSNERSPRHPQFPGENRTLEEEFHEKLEDLVRLGGIVQTRVFPVVGWAGCGKSTFLRYYFHDYRKRVVNQYRKFITLRCDLRDRGVIDGIKSDSIEKIGAQLCDMLGKKRDSTIRGLSENLRSWRQECPQGNVFVWIDNIDTAVDDVQIPAARELVDLFSGHPDLANLIDVVILPLRPETHKALEDQVLRRFEQRDFSMSKLKIEHVLKKRVDSLTKLLAGAKWVMSMEDSIDWPSEKLVAELPSDRREYTLKCDQSFSMFEREIAGDTSQAGVTPRYIVFRHLSPSDSRGLFDRVREYAAGLNFVESDAIAGPGSKTSQEIYRLLCGRSVARALHLSEHVINSRGVLITTLQHNQRLGAYTFLDAVISAEFNARAQFVVDLFDMHRVEGCFGASIALPYALYILDGDRSGAKVAVDEDRPTFVVRKTCVELLRDFGFGDGLSAVVVQEMVRRRFLRQVVGHPDDILLRSDYTWIAHRMLSRDIAYLDNVAQHENEISRRIGLKDDERTNGYDIGDMIKRYDRTRRFVMGVMEDEMEWLRNVSSVQRERMVVKRLPSVSLGCVDAYFVRVNGLLKWLQNGKFPRESQKLERFVKQLEDELWSRYGFNLDDVRNSPEPSDGISIEWLFKYVDNA